MPSLEQLYMVWESEIEHKTHLAQTCSLVGPFTGNHIGTIEVDPVTKELKIKQSIDTEETSSTLTQE